MPTVGISFSMMTAASAIMVPMDRSVLLVMITFNMPKAAMPTNEASRRIFI